VVFDAQPTGELFCGLDRFFAVAGNSLINRYGNELDILPFREEMEKKKKKCRAVLTPAQGNCHTILRDNHPPGFYGICNPLFHISGKMSPAQVQVDSSLVNNSRFCAQGTYRHIWEHFLGFQPLTPVCDPDNPNLIIRMNNRIL
jgi:hypothetical protein